MNRLRTPIALVSLIGAIGCGHSSFQGTLSHPFPPALDVQLISHHGQSVEVARFLAKNKLTIYDFYADWCANCRIFDTHIGEYAALHPNRIAYRKINIVDWESPVALQFLREIDQLPYGIVFIPNGKRFHDISGLDRVALFKLLDEASEYLSSSN